MHFTCFLFEMIIREAVRTGGKRFAEPTYLQNNCKVCFRKSVGCNRQLDENEGYKGFKRHTFESITKENLHKVCLISKILLNSNIVGHKRSIGEGEAPVEYR